MKSTNLATGLSFVLLLVITVGCHYDFSYNASRTPPPSTQSVPIYPGAQQVAVHDLPPNRAALRRVTSFQTQASPDAVLAYYREVLVKEGWNLNVVTTPPPHGLYFSWINGAAYGIGIVTKSQTPTLTIVELTLTREDPE